MIFCCASNCDNLACTNTHTQKPTSEARRNRLSLERRHRRCLRRSCAVLCASRQRAKSPVKSTTTVTTARRNNNNNKYTPSACCAQCERSCYAYEYMQRLSVAILTLSCWPFCSSLCRCLCLVDVGGRHSFGFTVRCLRFGRTQTQSRETRNTTRARCSRAGTCGLADNLLLVGNAHADRIHSNLLNVLVWVLLV